MTNNYSAYYKSISILVDLVILNVSAMVGFILVSSFSTLSVPAELGLIHLLLANFVWFNVSQLTKLYDQIFEKDAVPTIKQSLSSLLFFALISIGLLLLAGGRDFVGSWLVLSLFLFGVLLLNGKIFFLLWRRTTRAELINYKPIIIIGASQLGLDLKKYLEDHYKLGYRVVGFFDDDLKVANGNVVMLGTLADSIVYAREHQIKEVFCALPDSDLDKIQLLMRMADRDMIRFKMVADVKDYFRKNVQVQWFGNMQVLTPRTEPLENKVNQIIKRAFDLVFSTLTIVFLLSWLVPLMALLIKLDSKGPVFFKQLRSGKDNEPFYCLKFRSMVINEEADSRQVVGTDDRITRLGAFMRRNSVDELPQFFNVFMGEMSIVGPRPHMLMHTETYSGLIDQFMVRHLVLPGITGWAQTSGHRGETVKDSAMEARVDADIWYLENWSLLLDLKIIFLTVWHVIIGNEKAK